MDVVQVAVDRCNALFGRVGEVAQQSDVQDGTISEYVEVEQVAVATESERRATDVQEAPFRSGGRRGAPAGRRGARRGVGRAGRHYGWPDAGADRRARGH